VPYKDVIPLFAGCSLYVLASRTEAMGRVLLEAMACRKPVIASNVGGVPYVIEDGYNGLLFEKENVDDLAEKIKLVLSDNELAEKLAENGYMYVRKNLSEKNYINNYKNMINFLIETDNDQL
jgi:glycosyltransferase involved in cell wall biosynthesis